MLGTYFNENNKEISLDKMLRFIVIAAKQLSLYDLEGGIQLLSVLFFDKYELVSSLPEEETQSGKMKQKEFIEELNNELKKLDNNSLFNYRILFSDKTKFKIENNIVYFNGSDNIETCILEKKMESV